MPLAFSLAACALMFVMLLGITCVALLAAGLAHVIGAGRHGALRGLATLGALAEMEVVASAPFASGRRGPAAPRRGLAAPRRRLALGDLGAPHFARRGVAMLGAAVARLREVRCSFHFEATLVAPLRGAWLFVARRATCGAMSPGARLLAPGSFDASCSSSYSRWGSTSAPAGGSAKPATQDLVSMTPRLIHSMTWNASWRRMQLVHSLLLLISREEMLVVLQWYRCSLRPASSLVVDLARCSSWVVKAWATTEILRLLWNSSRTCSLCMASLR